MDDEWLDEVPDDLPWERVDAAGDWVTVVCPFCFESIEILLEIEVEGRMVRDCEVCCNPWDLSVRRRSGGPPEVSAEPL